MNLERVTFTGADDSTNIRDMILMSLENPLIEWGILEAGYGLGGRFPSADWIEELSERAMLTSNATKQELPLSLHLCANSLNEVMNTGLYSLPRYRQAFKRCQLNFHGGAVGLKHARNLAKAFLEAHFVEPIVQLDGVNDWVLDPLTEAGVKATGLFDHSHGSGRMPSFWPGANRRMGYSGGLGPENIEAELPLIAKASNGLPFWIDMETKVRTDGKFDLAKCEDVLRKCRND